MARQTIAAGLAALGAALAAVMPSDAQAGHQHWFFDSYNYYEQEAYPYHTHPRLFAPYGRGTVYEYQVAPGEWVRVHPRAVFPQYTQPRRRARVQRQPRIDEALRARVQRQPHLDEALRVPEPPLPKKKPQVAAPQVAEPEIAEPEVFGSLQAAEPKVAAKTQPKSEPQAGGRISCEAAAGIIGGFGFSDVKPTSCSGDVYGFEAKRDGAGYSISLSSADGELTEVKKR